MRMGTFVLGGLIGAAAAVYFTRNNKPMVFSSLSQAGGAVNKLVDTAREKMMGRMNANKTFEANESLDKVEELANQDPKVKHQVEEILDENGKGTFQTQ